METPEFRPVKDLTYNEAVSELENLLRVMQSDSCDIDLLTCYTKRATELLASCRSRLTATEADLKSALGELEKKC